RFRRQSTCSDSCPQSGSASIPSPRFADRCPTWPCYLRISWPRSTRIIGADALDKSSQGWQRSHLTLPNREDSPARGLEEAPLTRVTLDVCLELPPPEVFVRTRRRGET